MRRRIEEYLIQGQAKGWSARTVTSYRDRLEHLADYLEAAGRIRLVEVRPVDLDRYLDSLRAAGWKRESRKAHLHAARGFFAWVVRQGLSLTNPARHLEQDRGLDEELPPSPLSVAEVAAILDHLPRRGVGDLRNRAFLELLYGCALRIGEALALDVKDVDFEARKVHVRQGKGGKERFVPLGRGAAHALKDYLALRRALLRGPDNGTLFLNRAGRRLTDNAFRVVLRKLNRGRAPGVPRFHPHLLRHSAAVHLLQNGVDIRNVQEFLGHADLDVTKVYLRLVPGRLKEDYEKAMPAIPVGLPAPA